MQNFIAAVRGTPAQKDLEITALDARCNDLTDRFNALKVKHEKLKKERAGLLTSRNAL